jgi:hypothetical protein
MPAQRGEKDQGYGRTSRTYTVLQEDGTKAVYDSVTAILSVVGKPALIQWAANQERELVLEAAANLYEDLPVAGKKMQRPAYLTTLQQRLGKARAHQRELAKAAEIGSQVHALIEWNLRTGRGEVAGPEPRIQDKALWAFMAFEDWRKSVDLEPLAIEQTVWSSTYAYAGTLDLYAQLTLPGYGRVRAVIDWKTGKAIYDEALLQIAAYEYALSEMGHLELPVVGVILRLPKVETDPGFEARVVSADDLMRHHHVFLQVKALWDWQQAQQAERGAPTRSMDAAASPLVAEPAVTAAPPDPVDRAIRVIARARTHLGVDIVRDILAKHTVAVAQLRTIEPAVIAAVMADIEAAAAKKRDAITL